MATIRQYLHGEHPQRAVVTVVAVGITTAAILVPFGLLERGVSGLVGTSAFAIAFGVLPGLAGGICGWYRLGFPAAAGSGVAPGVVFYLIVAVGAALDVGSFGGGDSPLGPFALLLTMPSFLMAIVGFTLAVVVAILRQ
ncbi:hypothetical protein [Natronorubrum sp. FCH18a]|uniref:hypothetical protein n=1 Tax=Natronorubrum sp. FCH18a TaxID=3447018 RepID=UPI003F5131BB